METVMQVRECGFYDSTPPSFAKGEQLHGTKTFSRTVKLQRFAVDITPVTNRQYAEFLEKSHYHPPHRRKVSAALAKRETAGRQRRAPRLSTLI